MELEPREYLYLQGVTNYGLIRCAIYYRHNGKVHLTYTGNRFDSVDVARSEAAIIARDGITDADHGPISPDDIVSIQIVKRQEEKSKNGN